MRKLTIAVLAVALALILGLGTPQPAAAQTVTKKVASCNAKMETQYDKTTRKPHLIFLVAAKKACRDTDGNHLVAIRWVNNFQPSIDAKLKKMKNDFDTHFTNPEGTREPGLVGMAEKLLREMLGTEATALLPALAAEKKRIAAEKERIRLANEPARLAAEKIRLEKERLELEKCKKALPPPSPGQPAPSCAKVTILTLDREQLPTTIKGEPYVEVIDSGRKKSLSKSPTSPTEFYEFKLIDMLNNDPDVWFGTKIWLYQTLRRIAGPAGAKTPGEKEFLANMINYVRNMNISVAQGALDAYDAWKKGEGSKPRYDSKMAILIDYGKVPPDFNKLASAAVMGSAVAVSVAGMIASGALISYSITSSVMAATAPLTTSMYGLFTGGTSFVSPVFLAGAIVGPVAIVVTALAIAGVATNEIVQINKARGKLEKALTEAKRYPHVGNLLNAPKTAAIIQYFFSKATSKYSPTGMKDTESGCQACFYEGANFQGKSFCTQGRVNNLKKQTIAGLPNFHFGDKITSVKINDIQCKGAHVRLFEKDRMQGKVLTLIRSDSNIGRWKRGRGNWNDKVSSLEFIYKNAPQCEVCVFSDRDYKGGYFCAQGSVPDLKPEGWSDRASSIVFNIKSCPSGKAWLYEDEEFRGKSIALNKNNRDFKKLKGGTSGGRKEWDDDVTSLYFAPKGINPYSGRQIGGCRVCLYEETNYEGKWVCVNGGQGNAKLKEKDIDLNDKATSIDFQTKDCPKGKSIVATLYQHSQGKGSILQMDKSDPNFGLLKRGRKNWNDTVSSMYVKLVDTASFSCRVCLYEAAGYKGNKYCTNGSVSHLKDVGFNDKTSSIRIFNKSCKDAGVTVYENAVGRGRSARFTASTANVGRIWNDKITGIAFSPTMKATMRAEKARSDKQCRVCFYEHAGFGGKAFCTDGAYANLKKLRAGGRKEWNDDISSIRVDVPACRGGSVTIFEHANYGGKRTTLTKDHGDLKRLNAGGRRWGDQISSLRFNKPAKIKKWQTIKGGALDISIGPNGSIWVIGSNKVPYRWTGKSWKKVPGVKATRIDVGPKGWAWVVGTDGYGYHWRGNKWNKLAGVKISDVSIGANSKAWAIGTDKVGKNHSIYRFTGKWTKVPGSAVRIDVSPLGYPWVVSEHGRVYIWSEQLKKFLAIQPPHSANDIAVGVNGKTMVSIKAGGTATWNGGGWTQDRTKEKLTSIAIDKNNDPWVTTARNQIWAMR